MAGLRRDFGLLRNRAEPIRHDDTDSGAADIALGPLPLLHTQLAGSGNVSGGGGVWGAGFFDILPIPATLPKRTRTQQILEEKVDVSWC